MPRSIGPEARRLASTNSRSATTLTRQGGIGRRRRPHFQMTLPWPLRNVICPHLSESRGMISMDDLSAADYIVDVRVTLRPAVLDTQGNAILGGLHATEFNTISEVRAGKTF